jgi:hypothetical protein
MSAKNCQLCGKTLGRMRVGSDGDFCSREHRNQFRLRKGMDRLQEANQVATLMRRRDNPKKMPVALLLISPAMERRGAWKSARFPERHAQAGFPVSRPFLFRPRVPGTSRPLPGLSMPSLPAVVREMKPPAFLSGARVSPKQALRVRTIEKSVGALPPASVARLRLPVLVPVSTARECEAALRVSRRPIPGVLEIELGATGPSYIDKIRAFQNVAKARKIAAPPQQPAGLSFERPIPHFRLARRFGSVRSGLRGGGQPQFVPLDRSDITVHSLTCAAPIREHPVRLPSVTLREAGLAGGNPLRGSRALALPGDTYRLAEVPFAPAEWTFDHKPIALQGQLTAPRAEPAPGPLLEEDFNSGMKLWTGETADWRLDAAGARPGGLALFQPSLDLTDYDLEFLARIEKHGLTFVFRAANASNYQKVTIGVAASGRYELWRSVVIGGVEESPTVSPLGETPRPGSAFTVKMSARRNDFAISLEGEVAVHWTDGRLPAGAIGFTALRGDRARIYWVRLAPLGGPNSEAGPRRLPRSIQ